MNLSAEVATGLMGSVFNTTSGILRYKGVVVGYAHVSKRLTVGEWIYTVSFLRDIDSPKFYAAITHTDRNGLYVNHKLVNDMDEDGYSDWDA